MLDGGGERRLDGVLVDIRPVLHVPEPESDQAARAKHEERHTETEHDHKVAARMERARVAKETNILNIGVTDLQVPVEVGELDKLIIENLLKPRIAEKAACINYESMNNANKGECRNRLFLAKNNSMVEGDVVKMLRSFGNPTLFAISRLTMCR